MARIVVSESSMQIINDYKTLKGLESPTKALHALLHEYSTNVATSQHRAIQDDLREVCKV